MSASEMPWMRMLNGENGPSGSTSVDHLPCHLAVCYLDNSDLADAPGPRIGCLDIDRAKGEVGDHRASRFVRVSS